MSLEQKVFLALRNKMRWETDRGELSLEQLWDLDLEELDKIAIDLMKKLQEKEISFIKKYNKNKEILQTKFDIVKYIIDYKLDEKERLEKEYEIKNKMKMLQEMLYEAEIEEMKKGGVEKIKEELKKLQELQEK